MSAPQGKSSNSLANFPKELKAMLPYLQRANELEKKSPLVAFYCRTYAAQMGIGFIKSGIKSESATKFLLGLMDRLEKDKVNLNPNTEEGRAVVELYALKMFKKADDADRAGRQDDIIAKLFYACSILMEVTKQFSGELSEDIQEKQKYARWKAAEISRALKTGTKIQSGPYKPAGDTEQTDESKESQAPVFNITSGHVEDDSEAQEQEQDEEAINRILRSAQEEDQQSTNQQYSSYAEHPAIPKMQTPPSPQIPPASKSSSASSFSSSQSPYSSPSSYSHQPQPAKIQKPQPVHQEIFTPAQEEDPEEVPIEKIMEAQKLTKYAMSALQFNDVQTARKNLRDALRALGV